MRKLKFYTVRKKEDMFEGGPGFLVRDAMHESGSVQVDAPGGGMKSEHGSSGRKHLILPASPLLL